MLFRYHKALKKNEIDSLNQSQKDEIISIIKLIVERPFYSFFFYQITGTLNDVETFYEDATWLMNFLDKILDYMEEKYYPDIFVKTLQWILGGPCLIYFWIIRFFICLFRWRKYYRDSSLILLKIC